MDQDYMYIEEIVLNHKHSELVHHALYKVRIYVHYDQVLTEDHLLTE